MGDVIQNQTAPDFNFPEVDISATATVTDCLEVCTHPVVLE